MAAPCLVVHGGAGGFASAADPHARASIEEGLRAALAAGWAVLEGGGAALDAVVSAVAVLEGSGTFNAGRGSSPTTAGDIEMDASVMDGASGATGAICAARWPANPIRVAQAVATLGGPPDQPILLAGTGADDFARASGFGPMTNPVSVPAASESGTVGAVALDSRGHLAAGTSTGGREAQVPGRVGDSPIVGAATWASDDTAAVSTTGVGEAFLITGFAHRIDWAMRAGVSLADAMRSGFAAVEAARGTGGAIALTGVGEFRVAFDTPGMAIGWRDDATDHTAVVVSEADG